MSYTELHFHLLSGVDDGPATLEESVALARAAAADGTATILATPHVNEYFVTDVSSLPERVEEVAHALRRAGVRIDVLRGAELAHPMVARLTQAEFELIAQGPPGRRWLLLEAPLEGLDEDFAAAACELRDRGFAVVIAHPERALPGSSPGWRIIEDEIAAGSGLQVNAWSVAGLYGERVREHGLRAMRAATAVALASDAHGPERMPALRLGLDALAAHGLAQPERFASSIPASLITRGLPTTPRAQAA